MVLVIFQQHKCQFEKTRVHKGSWSVNNKIIHVGAYNIQHHSRVKNVHLLMQLAHLIDQRYIHKHAYVNIITAVKLLCYLYSAYIQLSAIIKENL